MPYKVRKGLLKILSKNAAISQVKSALQICFVFVLLLFFDSMNKMRHAKADHDHEGAKDVRTDTFQHAKMFYAQRNLYLTGSVLFLALILNRFHSMITELVKGTENIEVLKKQAATTSKEYMRLLDKDKEWTELEDKLKASEEKNKKADMLVKQAERTSE
ncbi:MAG: hypothetical protein SGCHY_004037, partial [Lobulomycetales sp.]